jgi:hypothetical protein
MCPACLCGGEAAGHNALRGSGPNRKHAFKDALTHTGSPNPRIDLVCITSSCPRQFLRSFSSQVGSGFTSLVALAFIGFSGFQSDEASATLPVSQGLSLPPGRFVHSIDSVSPVLIETSLCGYPNAQINSIRFKWMMAAAKPIKATPMPIAINQSKAW